MPKNSRVFQGEIANKYAQYGPELEIWKVLERPWLLSVLSRIPKPNSVLELGCGGGKSLEVLKEKLNPEIVVGLEPSSELAHHAKIQNPDSQIVQALSQELKFPKETFDLVTFINVIHLLSDREMEQTMDNVWHCLKPTGHLVVLAPIFFLSIKEGHKYGVVHTETRSIPWSENTKITMFTRTLGETFNSISGSNSKHPFEVYKFNELYHGEDGGLNDYKRVGLVAKKYLR